MSAARQLRDAAQAVVEKLTVEDLGKLTKPAAQALWKLTCAVDHYDRHAHAATPPTNAPALTLLPDSPLSKS